MKTLLIFLILTMTLPVVAQVKVRGYYRKDGTYVKPHYRSNPDGNPYNNLSYPGNTNPYTGKTATGDPDTYLRNYYNRSKANSNSSSSGYSYPSSTGYSYPSNHNYSGAQTYSSSTYYVTPTSLNVRSGPSANYSTIGLLHRAKAVKILESYPNGWKKVEYTEPSVNTFSAYKRKVGYVSGKYLNSQNESSTFPTTLPESFGAQGIKETDPLFKAIQNLKHSKITTTKMQAKLKKTPDVFSDIISYIPKNSNVEVLQKRDTYWLISYEGKQGFAHEMYFEDNEEVIASQSPSSQFGTFAHITQPAKLKKRAHVHGDIIMVIPKGAEVRVIGFRDGFWEVVYKNSFGYLFDGMYFESSPVIENLKHRLEY